MEFHIARKARERYQFAKSLFSFNGNVVLASMPACREFAHLMNKVRDVENNPARAMRPGALYAMGLIDEASHILIARYRETLDPQVITSAREWFSARVGADKLDAMLLAFVEQFPGATVISGKETAAQWLKGTTDGTSHKAAAFEELLLLWTANRNQAFLPFEELFEEKPLAEKTVYPSVTAKLPDYFSTRPRIPVPGSEPLTLLDLLRLPALRAPGSLSHQLELIRKFWRPLIGDALDKLLDLATEILREEELAIWMQFNPAGGAAAGRQQHGIVASAEVPDFIQSAYEYERFSQDTAWMPGVVLMAKSTYVWLAQLSRFYGRHIGRLDEIPDEVLATLAHRGINSLWLIGVWERSRASRTIKQLCGNRDAVASAYSLFDYTIAEDLGGESAYINLRDRCYRHGLRLASDMVPNHMGIDSPWVVEHPDWFMYRYDKPYPAYSFEGPDLSSDGRVEIKIEDHYFTQSDAAVVFRRRDKSSNETRYIYHGNDGTSFPWNDTAQLDYLNPAVREQVIQTILHVARLFPVIRFDAAMTLAKRHFHRLWFPGPGSSGAIPSRAEYGMSQAEFDRLMPHEFWRDVVDRVAAEVPGTLLLAEAFWLMEGYFVRTLGMHRVYNSAFMVMLRDEDNAKYRSVIKNTLEFDPDIMKRYVNFMSNPDERTTIDQFGKGDKCFGVAVMMSTLPGLPMFGHGQIEGYTEKYGMEYRWPRHEEWPDQALIARHDREIAPLLHKRWLFAESSNFLLYDFFNDNGSVNEDVFAYSNRNGGERALVVYNNRYGTAHGTIDNSAAYADKGSGQHRQRRLREGLGLTDDGNAIIAWRDSLTGLEYLRRGYDLRDRGLTLDLHAYQSYVFLDWRELYPSPDQPWDRLCDRLNGRGVPRLNDELVLLELRPVHDALRHLLEPGIVQAFTDLADHLSEVAYRGGELEQRKFFEQIWARTEEFLRIAQPAYAARRAREGQPPLGTPPVEASSLAIAFRLRIRAALRLPVIEALLPAPFTRAARHVMPTPGSQLTGTAVWGPILAWCVLEQLAESLSAGNPQYAALDFASVALDLFDRLRLREPLAQAFNSLGFEAEEGWRVAARIKVLLLTEFNAAHPAPTAPPKAAPRDLKGHDSSRANIAEKDKRAVALAGTQIEPDPEQGEMDRFESEGGRGDAILDVATEITPISTPAPFPSLTSALWLDPDLRWLTGAHEAEGHTYVIREQYEELLWWLQLPALLKLAIEPTPNREAVKQLSASVKSALSTVEAAGYRIDNLIPSTKPKSRTDLSS